MRTLALAILLTGCWGDRPTAAPDDSRPVRVYAAHTRRDVADICNAKWNDGYRIAELEPMPDGSFVLVLERR